MKGTDREPSEQIVLEKLEFGRLYGVLEYFSILIFILFQIAYFVFTCLFVYFTFAFIKEEIVNLIKIREEPGRIILLNYISLPATIFICIYCRLFLWSYFGILFMKIDKRNIIELGRDEQVVFEFIESLAPEFTRRPLSKIVIYPGGGVYLISKNGRYANIATVPNSIAIGVASINCMNVSEFKSNVVFNYALSLAESNLLYGLVKFTLNQLSSLVVSWASMLDKFNKIWNSSWFLRLLLFFAMIMTWLFLPLLYIGIGSLRILTVIAVPIRKKNHFFAAHYAVTSGGSELFVDCLLKERMANPFFEITNAFLAKAYRYGFVSADLYHYMSRIEAMYTIEKEESPQGQAPARAKKSNPIDARSRTTKETWEYYQRNVFEVGELEKYAMSLGVTAEIDQRSAWHLFMNGNNIKKQLTELHYKNRFSGGNLDQLNNKVKSSRFIDEEIKIEKIPDRYLGVYDGRDIEIGDINHLVAKVRERKIDKEEIRSLVFGGPSDAMKKSVWRLKELQKQEILLQDGSSHDASTSDPTAGLSAKDNASSAAATELQRIQKEIEVARQEVREADEEVFGAHWWLDPTSEAHCNGLYHGYFFHLELQKTIAACSMALDRLNEFLASYFENESEVYVLDDWKSVASGAKNAIRDLVADLPKNTRSRMILLFEETKLRHDLWGDEKEVYEILEHSWIFTAEFGARIQSLLDTAIKRLARIRFLSIWSILHDQEAMAFNWLLKNGG